MYFLLRQTNICILSPQCIVSHASTTSIALLFRNALPTSFAPLLPSLHFLPSTSPGSKPMRLINSSSCLWSLPSPHSLANGAFEVALNTRTHTHPGAPLGMGGPLNENTVGPLPYGGEGGEGHTIIGHLIMYHDRWVADCTGVNAVRIIHWRSK